MVIAGALLLSVAPLTIPAGFRSFPQIAKLVGETPREVKCDPRIAHRMAFVAANAISRKGLLRALDLVLVEEGGQKVLKGANAELEREWTSDLRRLMERRYTRYAQLALVATEERASRPTDEGFVGSDQSYMKVLTNPEATREERERAIDRYLNDEARKLALLGSGQWMAHAVAEFPAEIPPELVEGGTFVDVRPFATLSRRSLASLAASYPDLNGGPGSFLVRRRTLARHGMMAWIGIIDPSGLRPPVRVVSLSTFPDLGFLFSSKNRPSEKNGLLKLRRFATHLAEKRAEENEGRALVQTYATKVPPMVGSSDPRRPGTAFSLSNLTQAWAKRGFDVIQELDPESELLSAIFENGRMRAEPLWSPVVVEGVLVLRPLARFINGTRRFPYRALFALEATGETPQGIQTRTPAWPASESMSRYVALAGPFDRWVTTPYRGWEARYEDLDRAAASRRLMELVPSTTFTDSARVLREVLAKPNPTPYTGAKGQTPPGPVALWTHRVSELPISTGEAIIAQMRAYGDESNILAFSPDAARRLLSGAVMEVRVQESYQGYGRGVTIRVPGSGLFSGFALHGR